jgi:predicted glycoside hydrolase/deacetylase ChbG (UPF0249 family)
MVETVASTDAAGAGTVAPGDEDEGPGERVGRSRPTRFHADDLGLNQVVNDVTGWLLRSERLVGVSIVANGLATPGAAALVREQPDLPVNLHLNLTEGRPVSRAVPGLTSRDGSLLGPRRLVWALLRGRVDPGAIEQELNAQLDRLASLDVAVAGIDSHHHVHALSPVSDVVDRVAAERGIVRSRSYHLIRTHTSGGRRRKLLLASLARASSLASVGRVDLPTSWQSCSSRGDQFAMASWERLDRIADPERTTVVVHPGGACDKRLPLPTALPAPRSDGEVGRR